MTGLIECKRKDLVAALNLVMPAVTKQATIPILQNVKITALKNTVGIEANDLDFTITTTIPRLGTNKRDIEMTLPAIPLLNFVKAAGNDDLWIKPGDSNDSSVSLNAGAAMSLRPLPVADWPTLKKLETKADFNINIDDLLTVISTVKAAISNEDTRYYLKGAFFEPTADNKLTVTATDGHRLHSIDVVATGIIKDDISTKAIVPHITLLAVEKWLTAAKKAKNADPVRIRMGTYGIIFLAGTTVITSKCIDGTYPDWRRVRPTEHKCTAKIVSTDLENVLKVVKPANGQRPHVTFSFKKNECGVTYTDHDVGKISGTAGCTFDGGTFGPIEIGLNSSYLLAAMKALDCKSQVIEIDMVDPGSPIVIHVLNQPNPFVILMPVRV